VTIERIGLGGGCHWCTEAVFAALVGVRAVRQGFIRSAPPNEAPSEAVLVRFDPAVIGLSALIHVHLLTHASTSDHARRIKYRSAVYVLNDAQRDAVVEVLARLQPGFDTPIITQVLPLAAFEPSEARFRRYFATRPSSPFCSRYIDPKLELLKSRFPELLKMADQGGGAMP